MLKQSPILNVKLKIQFPTCWVQSYVLVTVAELAPIYQPNLPFMFVISATQGASALQRKVCHLQQWVQELVFVSEGLFSE